MCLILALYKLMRSTVHSQNTGQKDMKRTYLSAIPSRKLVIKNASATVNSARY